MRFNVGNETYYADFSFSKETPRITACVVGKQQAEPVTSIDAVVGVAKCSIKDNFNKATGKKLALLRALKELGFTKEQRKEVWEQYFKVNKMV